MGRRQDGRVPEIDLTLIEILFIIHMLYEVKDDRWKGPVSTELYQRFLSVWSYWSNRGKEESFTLRLKRM